MNSEMAYSSECLDEAVETRTKSTIAFINYFSKIIRQIKENACFDTRSYFLPANQDARLMLQPCFHTLI